MASLASFLRFMSTAFTFGSKTLNEKITKHEKTISKAEAKHVSVRRAGLFKAGLG